jgi:beta-galactosidase
MPFRCFLALVLAPLFAVPIASSAQTPTPRQQVLLSGDGWQFAPATADALPGIDSPAYTAAAWQTVAVPHVFETRQHYETPTQAWYRRDVDVPSDLAGKRLYVVFEGVTSVADVYMNGKLLGQHRGAYTRFLFDITESVHPGADNHLAVRVDNRVEDIKDLLPNKTRLYKLWGGINRKVWLLTTPAAGIDPTDFASPGIYITPTHVTAASADLSIQVLLRNQLASVQQLTATAVLLDPSGTPVQTFTAKAAVPVGKRTSVTLAGKVEHPLLWAPLAPQVYHLRVDISAGGRLIDSVTQPTGFRTVEFRWKEDLVLVNGKPTKLFGADIHQEIDGKENALSDAEITTSFDLMTDLGVNFMRLPHYPHAQLEYDLCDTRGILCWPEDGHTNDEIFGPTAIQIVNEMVKQNYNHPSLALWSVGNESLPATAEAAVPVVRALDANRPVVVANMKCATCDFRTANSYPGWYDKKVGLRDYTPTGFITEIGAGGVVTTHTDYNKADFKVNSYEPEEYQQLVAESHFAKAFDPANTKLAMFLWWTLRDFSDTKYKHPVGINTKGLTTYAGDKKDVYFLYRSFLRPQEPTVHITSKRYFLRRGAVDNGIKVYSNARQLTLRVNGQVVSTLKNGQYVQPDGPYLDHYPVPAGGQLPAPHIPNVFYWPVPMHTGRNIIFVSDGMGHSDGSDVYFFGPDGLAEVPLQGAPFSELTSSNPDNPVHMITVPVQSAWPIYSDLDSTADNSWNKPPAAVEGARWLALRRVTKPGMATTIGFHLLRPQKIFVAITEAPDAPAPAWLTDAKFIRGESFLWLDNAMMLVPARLYERDAPTAEAFNLTLGDADAVIAFK